MKVWKCTVCGYTHKGEKPPVKCPQCSSGAGEFLEQKKKKKLAYKREKLDVLLINGSTHRAHNTALVADLAEAALKSKKATYRRFNLSELDIQHCWCCYSMEDAACTYPCRNQLDDAPALHELLINSKAVIVCSPINWNNMSARLKDFLDRTTCIQNRVLIGKKSLTTGKVVGIIVNGHEDGAMKTAMDIFVYFQQMGYVLAPFGITYRTHGASYNSKEDARFFKSDKKLKKEVHSVVNNVVEMAKLDPENNLRHKLEPTCM